MENKLKYFLVVAEEMNISRAAKRCFITQQSMSMHIKQLEQELNVRLFNRKPNFSLTHHGEMFLNTLNQIKFLEEDFKNKVYDSNQVCRTTLNVGISHSRASMIMTDIIPKYKTKWPNIDIVLIHDDSFDNLASRLIRGQLDFFVGINHIQDSEDIVVSKLYEENIYLVISRNMLYKYIPHMSAEIIDELKKKFDILYLNIIPFISNTVRELTFNVYNKYFRKNNIFIRPIISCDDAYLRVQMSARDFGAAIILELMLRHVHDYNTKHLNDNRLYYFPIVDIKVPNVLAYHKSKSNIGYVRDFIDLVSEALKENYLSLKIFEK